LEIGSLGKAAFENLGNSSLFRESRLWQELNPLIYSALFPEKVPKKVDKEIEKKLAKIAEEVALESEVKAEVAKAIQNNEIAKQNLDLDPISQSITEDNTSIIFDDTKIDYEVFFLE
jgi:hypothetical protein